MFSPSMQTQDRDQKMEIGLAALLAMGIILLMLIEMIPKSKMATFPWLGMCIQQGCRSWVQGSARFDRYASKRSGVKNLVFEA